MIKIYFFKPGVVVDCMINTRNLDLGCSLPYSAIVQLMDKEFEINCAFKK